MNDDEKKMFRKFLETWHTFSAPKVIFLIFGVRSHMRFVEKISEKYCEILDIFSQNV